jgi:hypothetical protein
MQKTSKTRKTTVSKHKKEVSFPLEKQNFMIIGLGIVILIIGYVLMSQNSVDGFLPTVVAPIVLLIGYFVVIPYGILKDVRGGVAAAADAAAEKNVTTSSVSDSVSTNVKTS